MIPSNNSYGWYESKEKKIVKHYLEEIVLVNPDNILFIPSLLNLRATIECEKKIQPPIEPPVSTRKREVPALFWEENLILSDEKFHIFETKYYNDFDEILPIDYLNQIPEKFNKKFIKKPPKKISELADKLVGKEKDTRKILKKFYNFVIEHHKPELDTTGKSLRRIMKEYEKGGFFYGNCKEIRDFYSALCNSKGLPTKKVIGKVLEKSGGHTWADVFIPTDRGYKLFPVDGALRYFGYTKPLQNVFLEFLPSIQSYNPFSFFIKSKKYKIKIEHTF